MECYSCETLINFCKKNKIQCSRLSKKEMYTILVEKDIIDKDPSLLSPSPPISSRSGRREEKKEKYYLGEETRDFEFNF